MKKLALIALLLTYGGCSNQVSKIAKQGNEKLAKACERVATKKKHLAHEEQRAARKIGIAKSMIYGNYHPAIAKTKNVLAASSNLESSSSEFQTKSPIERTPQSISTLSQKLTSEIVINSSVSQAKNTNTKVTAKRNAFKPVQRLRQSAQTVALMAFTTLLAAGLFKASEKKMRNLSRWANEHPALARTTIVGAQSIATVGGLGLGHYLYNQGVEIPTYAMVASAAAFTAGWSLYPNRYSTGSSIPLFSYFKRKVHDMTLYSTGAMMMVYAGNHYDIVSKPTDLEKIVISATVPGSENQIQLIKNNMLTTATPLSEQDSKRGEKIGLTILASIGFTVLLFLVAAFSCSIACSGNEGMALLVAIAGTGLVIWGLTAVIRNIWKGPKKTVPSPKQTL